MSAGDWKNMFQAIQNNDIQTVKYHLNNGVDPNHQHPEILCSPLVEAIKLDQKEIVELLINAGADPSIKSVMEEVNGYEAIRKWNRKDFESIIGKPDGFWEKLLKKRNK